MSRAFVSLVVLGMLACALTAQTPAAQEPVWSRAGGEIFFRSADKMMAAAVRTQPGFEVLGRSLLFTGSYDQAGRYRDYDVTRDGQTFVMLQPAQSTALSVFVTLNWFDQFRRRK